MYTCKAQYLWQIRPSDTCVDSTLSFNKAMPITNLNSNLGPIIAFYHGEDCYVVAVRRFLLF